MEYQSCNRGLKCMQPQIETEKNPVLSLVSVFGRGFKSNFFQTETETEDWLNGRFYMHRFGLVPGLKDWEQTQDRAFSVPIYACCYSLFFLIIKIFKCWGGKIKYLFYLIVSIYIYIKFVWDMGDYWTYFSAKRIETPSVDMFHIHM